MKRKGIVFAAALVAIVSMLGLTGCASMPYGDLNLDDYIKVGEYTGLKAEKISVEVTQTDIDNKISSALDSASKETELKKGDVLKSGDNANINYVGTLNGKAFDGGSADDYNLELGSGTFIEGFEEGLIGHKVGETGIKLNLAFPLNYQSDELKGKDVVFTVDINSAKRTEKAKYNMDFVKSQGDYASKKEYEKAIKKKVYKEKKTQANTQQQNELWSQIVDSSEVKKYPEEPVNAYTEMLKSQVSKYAESYGVEESVILSQMFGVTKESELSTIAQDYVK